LRQLGEESIASRVLPAREDEAFQESRLRSRGFRLSTLFTRSIAC